MSNAIFKIKSFGPPTGQTKFDGPVRTVFNVFFIFIISQMTAGVIVEAILAASGSSRHLSQSPGLEFIYILFAEAFAVSLVYLILRRRKLSLADIGLGRKPVWRDATWALGGFGAFYGLLIVATIILTLLIPGFDTEAAQDVGFNVLNTPTDQIIAFVALVILPPLGEETLMRGYLYSALRARWRFIPAMLLTSILFGLAHLSTGVNGALWAAGVDTLILSMVLVYVRERTGALYAAMAIHSLNNMVAFFVHFHG